ncbi:MAG: hypothetical protein Q8P82_01335 [bacterium]|nr:hypothetical protein [bacterium]
MTHFFRRLWKESWEAAMSQAFTGDASVMLGAAFMRMTTVCREVRRERKTRAIRS